MKKIARELKDSNIGFIFTKFGLRKSSLIRKFYSLLTLENNKDPIRVGDYKFFIDRNDSLGLKRKKNLFNTDDVAKTLKMYIGRGHVVIDAGANIGVFSVLMSKLVGGRGKVYAFEPDKINFEILLKNLKINKCDNVIPINKALSDKNGRIKLYLSEWNKGDHRIYPSDEKRKSIEIETVTLDSFLKEKIDFLKIDIQGAEALMFKGAKKSIFKNKPKFILEFWPVGIKDSGEDYVEFIKQINKNFNLYQINQENKKVDYLEILKLTPLAKRNFLNLLCIPK